jgi:adenylate kinase family enzyme
MMESRYNKIYITGASGTGKTTLAKWVEEEFDLPFISTSAKNLWPKYGFKNHSDAIIKSITDLDVGQDYQHNLLEERMALLKDKSHFVTDRSPIDNYAYVLLQGGFQYCPDDLEYYAIRSSAGLNLGDLVIFVRYSDDIILQNDGARIVLPDYQRVVDSTMSMIIRKNLISKHSLQDITVLELKAWDWEKRKHIVTSWLKK